jgi:beta-N-acetylhexosaminidase
MRSFKFLVLVFLCFNLSGYAQKDSIKSPEFLKFTHSVWVDSVMTTLSQEERIAQLIMVAAYSNRGEEHRQEILKHLQHSDLVEVVPLIL